jgi:hypothetical protein
MSSTVCRVLENGLTAPHDVLAALPALLGFHPTDSLVAVYFGEGDGILMTARLDWDSVGPDLESVAGQLVGYATRCNASGIALIVVGPTRNPAEQEATLIKLHMHIGRMGVGRLTVLWTVHLQAGRWWSNGCLQMCGAESHQVLQVYQSPLAFALTLQGRAPEATREDVLAPSVFALDSVRIDVAEHMARPTEFRWSGVDLEHLILTRGELNSNDLANLIRACDDISSRDALLLHFTQLAYTNAGIWRDGLIGLETALAHAPQTALAGIASVTGFFWWQAGDGLRASAAVDLALQATPAYPLARLLRIVLQAGIPPNQWPPKVGASPHKRTAPGPEVA